jgi:hypothetical protein
MKNHYRIGAGSGFGIISISFASRPLLSGGKNHDPDNSADGDGRIGHDALHADVLMKTE